MRVVSGHKVLVLHPHEQTARQPDGTGHERQRCVWFMAYLRGNAAGLVGTGGWVGLRVLVARSYDVGLAEGAAPALIRAEHCDRPRRSAAAGAGRH